MYDCNIFFFHGAHVQALEICVHLKCILHIKFVKLQNFLTWAYIYMYKVPIGFQNFLQEIHWNITKLDLTGHLANKNKTYRVLSCTHVYTFLKEIWHTLCYLYRWNYCIIINLTFIFYFCKISQKNVLIFHKTDQKVKLVKDLNLQWYIKGITTTSIIGTFLQYPVETGSCVEHTIINV